jgi:hypothetical protein
MPDEILHIIGIINCKTSKQAGPFLNSRNVPGYLQNLFAGILS